MNVNFPIEHVISAKPNKDSLDPPAPVKKHLISLTCCLP